MAESTAKLFERALLLRRTMLDDRRDAHRTSAVPFVPRSEPRGWRDLAAEIEEEFDRLSKRDDEIFDALTDRGIERQAQVRKNRRLDGPARRRKLAAQREWVALMRDAGRCCW